MKGEPKAWITVNGKHVPIYDAQKALSITAKKSINPKEIARAQAAVKEAKDPYEDDEHHATALGKVKKGDFFKLSNKPNAKVYVRDDYDPSEKAYWVYEFYDVNSGRYMKKNKTVYTGFTF